MGLPKGDDLADRLREYHQRGVDVREHGGSDSEAELMERFKVSKDLLYKTQAFARYYDADELESLCADRDVDGNPLRWAHVRELLVYRDDRKARLKQQKQAVRKQLTVDELREQIQRDRGGRSRIAGERAGPRFKFGSVVDAVRKSAEIERLLASLAATIGEGDDQKRRIEVLLKNCSAADRDAVDRLVNNLTAIRQHADDILQVAVESPSARRRTTKRRKSIRST